jgi:competence protein ComEA
MFPLVNLNHFTQGIMMTKLLKAILLAAGIAGLIVGTVHAREEAKQPSKQTSGGAAAGGSASGSATTGAAKNADAATSGASSAGSSSGSSAGSKAATQLDINSASEKELASLPKIGEAKSKAIVKNRPYRGKDDLVNKKILTQNEYDEIKDQIVAKQKPASGDKKK